MYQQPSRTENAIPCVVEGDLYERIHERQKCGSFVRGPDRGDNVQPNLNAGPHGAVAQYGQLGVLIRKGGTRGKGMRNGLVGASTCERLCERLRQIRGCAHMHADVKQRAMIHMWVGARACTQNRGRPVGAHNPLQETKMKSWQTDENLANTRIHARTSTYVHTHTHTQTHLVLGIQSAVQGDGDLSDVDKGMVVRDDRVQRGHIHQSSQKCALSLLVPACVHTGPVDALCEAPGGESIDVLIRAMLKSMMHGSSCTRCTRARSYTT